jgi:hypothetical protein
MNLTGDTMAQGQTPKTTYNIDVHSIVRRYNRILAEVNKAQSSGVSFTNPFDVARLTSYVSAMREFQKFIVSQPLLDCPETGPIEMDLPVSPALPMMENESMQDVVNLVEIARDEIANSQSSRQPTNLLTFDYARQTAFLAKLDTLLSYVAVSEPLDLPESSPQVAMTGPGKLGV